MCAHPGCHCPAGSVERNGKRYCSEHCAQSPGPKGATDGCGCGHPSCGKPSA